MTTTWTLEGPATIVVIEGLTLPEVRPEYLAAIEAAAPPGSSIKIAGSSREAAQVAGDAQIILGYVNERLFAASPALRWVHAVSSGVDAQLFPAFLASDVILTGEKGLVGGHLADTGFGLLLALTRQIHSSIRLGPAAWDHRVEMRMKELELDGMTMGIVGFGGTGRAMARRATAFGMQAIAVDEHPSAAGDGVEEVWPPSRFDELLARADVVAICCPLTPATSSLLDKSTVARMKPGAFLVNVTRGEIVDNEALVDALEGGHLGGAALDVVDGEPLPADHRLFQLDNVVMTPHTAGASQHRAPRNVARFVENLGRARAGLPLVGVVDKRAGY